MAVFSPILTNKNEPIVGKYAIYTGPMDPMWDIVFTINLVC